MVPSGGPGSTRRLTSPSATSSWSRSESTVSDRPGTAGASSLKRAGRCSSNARIRPDQRLPTTSKTARVRSWQRRSRPMHPLWQRFTFCQLLPLGGPVLLWSSVKGEVAVVGLGVMGACTLWRLAERGVRAVGFEQFQPGHDRGASHGETRIIRTAYYEGVEYVPLAQAAFGLWRDLEAAAGETLLTMTGALMMGAPNSELVAGALRSAKTHGLAHELLDREQMAARYPQHRLLPGE